MIYIITEGEFMANTNLNIRTDIDVKKKANAIFQELGMSMTTAVNLFLKTAIRENGIPFSLKLEIPNEMTIKAIEEGRKIAGNKEIEGFSNIKDLKKALEV